MTDQQKQKRTQRAINRVIDDIAQARKRIDTAEQVLEGLLDFLEVRHLQ